MPFPKPIAKVKRTLAREEAYIRLRQGIIEGTLRPGEMLRDQEIAAALGISRTPVREALRRLEDEGLVETSLNRWTRVAPLDLTKIAEIYAIIEALEVRALELAFDRLENDDLESMTQINSDMRQAAQQQDAAAAVSADETFHELFSAKGNNGQLSVLLGRLKWNLRRAELAYFDSAGRADESFREHMSLIKALSQHSLSEARSALERNWHGSLQRLLAANAR